MSGKHFPVSWLGSITAKTREINESPPSILLKCIRSNYHKKFGTWRTDNDEEDTSLG